NGPAMLDCLTSLDLSATTLSCLSDDGGQRVTRHRPIALRECGSVRVLLRPELGQHRAMFSDFPVQITVHWIRALDACSEDSHGTSPARIAARCAAVSTPSARPDTTVSSRSTSRWASSEARRRPCSETERDPTTATPWSEGKH